jgi:predicted alpha-1,2-mannosidase
MLAHHKTQGHLPIGALWGKEDYCMIGNHAIPVIVDAYLKGFDGFDAEEAYKAIKESSTVSHKNSDWETYDKYGYYPFDIIKIESVSRTLESAYDDYCVAQMAKALGKNDDYAYFSNRSGFYKNLFDNETGMMRGKDSEGKWRTPFNTFSLSHAASHGGDYTEGNAWQYTWHVQHDVEGLIALMGGEEPFSNKLDSLFYLNLKEPANVLDVTGLIGQYAHGNEPSHHVTYLYNYLDRPYKTQELIREIFDGFYLPEPNGLCGNDDCGQMSAWYIFSAMGFYPVNPCGGEYIIGAPQIQEITLHLENGKKFGMKALNLSNENKYVKSVSFNGAEITDFRIQHKDIMNGGALLFTMTNQPGE